MARQMKDSGIEWIEEVPEGWEVARLKQKFEFGKGLPITKEDLVEQGIPVISYGQIHSKLNTGVAIRQELIRFVPETFRTTNSSSFVAKNDFILADTSEDLLGCGNCVFVDQDTELFAGYHTIILRAATEHDNKYLAYLFLTDAWRSQIRAKVSGVKLFSISRKILSEATLLLPPPIEQERIVAFLDRKCAEIDAVIERTKATIEEYKKLKQAVITEAVTKGVRGARKMKDSGIEWIGEIPKDWRLQKLKNVTSLITDGTHVTPNYIESGVPFLSIKDISSGRIDFSDAKFISDEEHQQLSKSTPIERGDMLFTRIGTLGVFVFVDTDTVFDIFVSVGLIKFRTSVSEANKHFIRYFLLSTCTLNYINLVKAGGGTAAAKFNLSDVRNTVFAIPSDEEQVEIVAYLDEKCAALDTLTAKKTALLTELETYKKSLIYEYVTGKKEVVE